MSKYNARKTLINGILFDSKAEGNYYLTLKEKLDRGEIKALELQPRFTLLDGFKKNGKTFRPIHYKADFKVVHLDGSIEIIDVKGFITKDFAIKLKLFEDRFRDLSLTLVDGKGNKK